MNSNFVFTTFLDACKVPTFHNKWMSAQTWAEVIVQRFSITPDLQFDGQTLVNTIARKKHFATAMDMAWNNAPVDHHGIFRHMLIKNGKRIHYYFATTGGGAPSLESNWTEAIDDASDIFKIKITRSNVLATTADMITAVANTNTIHKKRKVLQTQNIDGGLLDGGSEGQGSDSRPSSSPPCGVVCEAFAARSNAEIYWTSTEAKVKKLWRQATKNA